MQVSNTGKFIRQLRKEHKLSQEELAAKVLVSRQAVSSWEREISLPDSVILLELSEIFNVSIKELLLGEKNENLDNVKNTLTEKEINEIKKQVIKQSDNKKEYNKINDDKFINISNKLIEEYSTNNFINKELQIERDGLEKIVLNLVDKYNDKSRALKKTLIALISTIAFILLIFFAYYFINSYNTIQVFKIKGKGNEFYTQNGIMINTKQKSYIRIGKLESFKEKEIDSVELYFYDEKKEKHTLYKDRITDILLTDYYGYNELYDYKDLKCIKNNLYIDIYYENKVENIKLEVVNDFSNNKIFNTKTKKSTEEKFSEEKHNELSKQIIDALKEKGEDKEGLIKYHIENKNEIIDFEYNYGILKVDKLNEEKEKIWNYPLNQFDNLFYEEQNSSKESKIIVINSKDLNKNKEQLKIYNEMLKIIYSYLLD